MKTSPFFINAFILIAGALLLSCVAKLLIFCEPNYEFFLIFLLLIVYCSIVFILAMICVDRCLAINFQNNNY